MNLTWHIVKKDLRALKWPLVLWTAVIVAKLGIGVTLLTSVGTINADWFATWFERMAVFAKVLAGLECVSFVLVAAVIHEDLLVGTTAFWMTRPISGARLLRAKILGIGLMFWVLPVLVTLPWWLGCGYGLREIAWAALETVAVQTLCVLLGLLWGVVTDGFARFLLWTLVLLFAVPTVSSVISLHFTGLKVKPTPELVHTRICIDMVIAVATILTVTVHQFLTRRTWRSVGILGAAAGLMITIALWWPWNWKLNALWEELIDARIQKIAQTEEVSEVAGLKFTAGETILVSKPNVPTTQMQEAEMNFSITDIPAARMLVPQLFGRYTLQWADGTTYSRYTYGWINYTPFRLMAWQSLSSPLPSAKMERRQDFAARFRLPAAIASRAKTERPHLTVKSVFRLLKFESAMKFSLQPGARILTGSAGERVAQVDTMDGQVFVTYIKSRPDFFLGEKVIGPYSRAAMPYSIYGLVNQAAGKSELGVSRWVRSSRIASVKISLEAVSYGHQAVSGRKSALPETWLRDAELVRQTFIEDRRFSHIFDAGQFPTKTLNR